MRPHIIPLQLSPFLLFTALACGNTEPRATIAGDNGDNAGPTDTAVADWDLDQPGASCLKSAPAVEVSSFSDADGQECRPTPAARTFTRALCSCEDTNVAGFLHTRSFHSRRDSAGTERLGGSVGVNRNYITGGLADIGGNFTISGRRDTLFGGLLKVGGSLQSNPSLDVAGLVDIGADAYLAQSLRALALIGIHGDLYRSPESDFVGLALVNVGGERYRGAVDVPEPCGCGPSELLDVAGAVDAARDDNDNAAIGLDPHAPDLMIGLGTALTLPSGRYFVHQVGSLGAIRLRISGHVQLYVEDDFLAGPLFAVTLDPDAELDLYVRDNFALAGGALLGDPARPAATRIYVGGTGDIAVAGLNAFAGNLYAPTANVLVGGVGKVWGSLFGKNILAAGFLDVGFDEAVRDGVDCSNPEPPVTEPPTTDPPTTDPPTTEPDPTTEPPTNEPPTHEPPATEPDPTPDSPPGGSPTPTPSEDPPVAEPENPCVPYEVEMPY